MRNPYSYIYASINKGDLLVTHIEKNIKDNFESFEITSNGVWLTSVSIPSDINPVVAMVMLDKACEALDYSGE